MVCSGCEQRHCEVLELRWPRPALDTTVQTSVALRWDVGAHYPSQRPLLTPHDFASDGRDRPAETLVGIALSR